MIPVRQVLKSEEDLSVNFVFDSGLEARYVRRPGTDYAIVYLSSHRGCNQACRMCHLTQTKQVEMTPTRTPEFIWQATKVLEHYDAEVFSGRQTPVKIIHFNWMARGEPLLNQELAKRWPSIVRALDSLCQAVGVSHARYNFSTIFPRTEGREDHLLDYMRHRHEEGVQPPTIFYSLYSASPSFRKRWLPNALDPWSALHRLRLYQDATNTNIVLHWAFIEGENDSEKDVAAVCDLVRRTGVRARFNLVRYNPYSPAQGKEPSEEVLQARFQQLKAVMKIPGSRIVPRVGRDVAASCGQFINLHQK